MSHRADILGDETRFLLREPTSSDSVMIHSPRSRPGRLGPRPVLYTAQAPGCWGRHSELGAELRSKGRKGGLPTLCSEEQGKAELEPKPASHAVALPSPA